MLSFCSLNNLEKPKVIRVVKEKAQKVYQPVLGGLNKTCGATFYIVASFTWIVEETRLSGTYNRYFFGLGGTHIKWNIKGGTRFKA